MRGFGNKLPCRVVHESIIFLTHSHLPVSIQECSAIRGRQRRYRVGGGTKVEAASRNAITIRSTSLHFMRIRGRKSRNGIGRQR